MRGSGAASNAGDDQWQRPLTLLAVHFLFLIGPSIFAVATFSSRYELTATRYFAIPFVIVELLVIAMAWIDGFRPLAAMKSLKRASLIAALALLGAAGLSTAFANVQPGLAYGHFILTLIHALFGLALFERLATCWSRDLRSVLMSAGLGVALYSIVIFAILYSFRHDPDFPWVNYGAGGSNVRHLSYYAIIPGGIGAGLIATATNLRDELLSWVIASFGIFLAVWSGGRMGVAAIAAAMLIAFFLAERHNRLRCGVLMLAAVAGGAALSLIWVPPHPAWGLPRIIDSVTTSFDLSGDMTSGRIALWQAAWRGIAERPVLGYGEGQFRWVEGLTAHHLNHPHNVVIQSLFQWGSLGTVALAALASRIFLVIPQAIKNAQTSAIPAFVAVLAAGGLSLTDGNLFYPYHTAMFVFTLAVIGASAASSNRMGKCHSESLVAQNVA